MNAPITWNIWTSLSTPQVSAAPSPPIASPALSGARPLPSTSRSPPRSVLRPPPHLSRSSNGMIVNVASVAGLSAFPQAAHYAAAKAELIALTSALANAWVVAGIRVNAVCPGWTRTDMTRDLWGSPAVSDAVLSHVPLNRWASAEEIAATVLFLATSTHTGTVLTVDGGLLACVDERRG
ncbi:SDR family oxidoreductase [Streptomyces sp. NBC_01477]